MIKLVEKLGKFDSIKMVNILAKFQWVLLKYFFKLNFFTNYKYDNIYFLKHI